LTNHQADAVYSVIGKGAMGVGLRGLVFRVQEVRGADRVRIWRRKKCPEVEEGLRAVEMVDADKLGIFLLGGSSPLVVV